MKIMRLTTVLVCGATTIGVVAIPAAAATSRIAAQKAAAASVTTRQANAMQAVAVARHGLNAVLHNPYIEQKVTTPESTGVNVTRIPAGGF